MDKIRSEKKELSLGESKAEILPTIIIKKVDNICFDEEFFKNFITIGYKWKDARNNKVYGSFFYLPKDKINDLIEELVKFNK